MLPGSEWDIRKDKSDYNSWIIRSSAKTHHPAGNSEMELHFFSTLFPLLSPSSA